jgi:hypothetical protein
MFALMRTRCKSELVCYRLQYIPELSRKVILLAKWVTGRRKRPHHASQPLPPTEYEVRQRYQIQDDSCSLTCPGAKGAAGAGVRGRRPR